MAEAPPELSPQSTAAPARLTLGYDAYSPAKDPRSRRLLPTYWLGTLLAGLLYGIITTPIYVLRDSGDTFGPWINGLVLSVGFTAILILPDTIFLGITIWLRAKLLKEVRFAKFRTALITGFIGGLYPAAVLQVLNVTPDTSLNLLFVCLGWHVLFPIAAGFWLCYRSNLRD